MNATIRAISITALASASILAVAPAQAKAPVPQQVIITATPTPEGAAAQVKAILGAVGFESTYRMSDGTLMVLSAQRDEISMRYGRRHAVTLHDDGQGRFVSGNGDIVLAVATRGDDAAGQVRLARPLRW